MKENLIEKLYDVLYDPNDMTLWKSKNCRNTKKFSDCKGQGRVWKTFSTVNDAVLYCNSRNM